MYALNIMPAFGLIFGVLFRGTIVGISVSELRFGTAVMLLTIGFSILWQFVFRLRSGSVRRAVVLKDPVSVGALLFALAALFGTGIALLL